MTDEQIEINRLTALLLERDEENVKLRIDIRKLVTLLEEFQYVMFDTLREINGNQEVEQKV